MSRAQTPHEARWRNIAHERAQRHNGGWWAAMRWLHKQANRAARRFGKQQCRDGRG